MIEKIVDAKTKKVTVQEIEWIEPIIPIEQIQAQKLNELQPLFDSAKEKGMPFLANDGNTYHMQARDKDRINVLGLYTGAKDFLQSGDLIEFTPYEPVKNVSVERDSFIAICMQFFGFYSALHFAKKEVEEAIKTETNKATLEAYNVQEAFQTALTALIS